MDHFVITAYALGGACFAILLSGNVNDEFAKANPWTAGLLGAGVPTALGSAFLYERNWPKSRIFAPIATCLSGVLIAGAGVLLYFFSQHSYVRTGFLGGVVFLASIYLRSFNKKHRKFEESLIADAMSR
ncbi:MAG: hypothetical protein J0M17_11150 [Planctomycetes bacterium]|nr:hypothetical protein [Planctomycetota bacterium]